MYKFQGNKRWQFVTSQAHAVHTTGPIAIGVSIQGLGRPGNGSMADSWRVWLVRVSWFVRLLAGKGSQVIPVLLAGELQLLLYVYLERAPQAWDCQETGSPCTCKYGPAEVRNCTGVTVLCHISELYDPVDSQHQLECISPPVCSPTTCVVTRTYYLLVTYM